MRRNYTALSIEVSDKPPTEFRIFTAGVVDTVKGEFNFDSKAAKLVLAEYEAHGIDLMIDYDHASLSAESAIDPANAGKAAGWFNIEVRNGELWAVNVRWTPPAAEALSRKEWRFMSPAFGHDKTGRITSLLNVALTNIPATRQLDPLVAASAKGKNVDPKLIQQALEAIEKGDAKSALDLLKSLVASAAGADPDSDGDEPGSEGDGAEGVAPPAEAAVEDPKVVDASEESAPAADDDEDEDKPEKKAARKALNGMLCRLTGKKTLAEAVAEVETFRASHLTLESERTKLAKERATMESAERRKLVADLVTLGAEFPSTVWADDKATTIKPRWARMPIAELRSHVAEQRLARKKPAAQGSNLRPAAATEVGGEDVKLDDGSVVSLSAFEVKIAKSQGCELKDFATLRAVRDGKKV